MSDPLPAAMFNPRYDARPADIGARYAAGIGASRREREFLRRGHWSRCQSAPPREPHHLLPTPDPIDASVVKAILDVPQFLTASLYTSH